MENEIKSLTKAFHVIEYLSSYGKEVSLTQISKECALPPATAHRIVNNLCTLGYVKNDDNRMYRMTVKLFEIASTVITGSTLLSIARPHLERLSERINESVHLVVRDGIDIVYFYKIARTVGSIQMASKIGMRLPMYRTAVGKATIATMSDDAICDLYQNCTFEKKTPKTIESYEGLCEQIAQIRSCGYAVDDEENEDGVKCIAFALATEGKEAAYAFSASALSTRMTDERMHELAHIMGQVKNDILSEMVFS